MCVGEHLLKKQEQNRTLLALTPLCSLSASSTPDLGIAPLVLSLSDLPQLTRISKLPQSFWQFICSSFRTIILSYSSSFPGVYPEGKQSIVLASWSSWQEYISFTIWKTFSSSHVQMWKLDHKEGWVPKNWCFWTVVLEKTLESSLDCKEVQPVHPKGSQSWIFIGKTDDEAEAPILWPPDGKKWLIEKDPSAGKDWREEVKGATEDEMVRWHHGLSGHDSEQTLGDSEGQGSLACPRGHKELDMT